VTEKGDAHLHAFLFADCEASIVEEFLVQLIVFIFFFCHDFFSLPIRSLLFTWFQLMDAD